jgi:hypothetical protein
LKCFFVQTIFNFVIQGKEEDENSQHDWIATSAELTPNRNEMPAVSEDIIMHEGHQGNVLDSKVRK